MRLRLCTLSANWSGLVLTETVLLLLALTVVL